VTYAGTAHVHPGDGSATVRRRFDARNSKILRIGILLLLVFEIGSYLLA